MHRVVIVGGGFGGLAAAQALDRAPVEVTVLDRWNHHLFQPLLYQVAMAGLSPAEIAYPIRSALRASEHTRVLLGEVVGVNLEERSVELLDGARLSYDYLVLAVGSKNDYFGREATWGRYALGLKTLDEALEIRRRVLLAFEAAEREDDEARRTKLLTFVVIGGGPTGVEVAGALAELSRFVLARDFRRIAPEQARVVLVERNERLLSGGFSARLAASARRQLESLGVEVLTGCSVEVIDAGAVELRYAAQDRTERVEAANVFWTAGVRARSLAGKLGAPVDRAGRVVVAADCSLPGHPEVFALGDMACFVPEGETAPLPGLAPVAIQQGRFVARQIQRELAGAPRERFRYRDRGIMATIGRSRAVAQTGRLQLGGWLAWLAWLFVHLLYLVGFRNRVSVLFNWAFSYFTYERGARIITGDRSWARLAELGEAPPYAGPRDEEAPAPRSVTSAPDVLRAGDG